MRSCDVQPLVGRHFHYGHCQGSFAFSPIQALAWSRLLLPAAYVVDSVKDEAAAEWPTRGGGPAREGVKWPRIAFEYSLHPNQLHRWKRQAIDHFAELFQKDDKQERAKEAAHERQLEALYAEIGRLTTQVNWLQKKSGLDVFEK
jgi:hypothetical protein